MKKYILFIALLVFTSTTFAQNKTLLFFAEKGEEFSVVYNNVIVNEKPSSLVKVSGVRQGNCTIGIMFKGHSAATIYKKINLSEANEFTYIIRKEGAAYILKPLQEIPVVRKSVSSGNFVYYSSASLLDSDPVVTTNTSTYSNVVDCEKPSLSDRAFVKAKYEIDSKSTNALKKAKAEEIITSNCLLASQVVQIIKQIPDPAYQLELAKLSYAHTYDIKNYLVVVNALTSATDRNILNQFINGEYIVDPVEVVEVIEVPAGDCPMPASDEDFRLGKNAVAKESFDGDRVAIAKQFVSNHCLTTNQVIELINQLTFESSKLEFAKFAYTHTYDRKNYYLVNSCFSFSNSKSELNAYISSVK